MVNSFLMSGGSSRVARILDLSGGNNLSVTETDEDSPPSETTETDEDSPDHHPPILALSS